MAERNPSRPWSEEEDLLLTNAVQIHGEHENWKNIASLVPGRTNKACRKRWLHSLSPTIKKSAWTSAEDDMLVSLYNIHGTKWSTIAREIPGRTDDACSKRYREALDPALKKDEWTPEEDRRLMQLFAEIGGKWGQVGQELQRSGLGCRNRHRLLSKRGTKVFHDAIPNEVTDTSGVVTAPHPVDYMNWLYPYCPSEPYSGEEGSLRYQTLPVTVAARHETTPFDFSISSLSTALSVVPQGLVTPAEDVLESSPECSSGQDGASASNIDPLSQDDYPIIHDTELSQIFLGVHFDDNGVFHYPAGIFEPHGALPETIDSHRPCDVPDSIPSPASAHSISSNLSTPYSFSVPLSNSSTPNSFEPIDLPSLDTPNRRSQATNRRSLSAPDKPLRLSSSLTLTSDSSIRPYACGREKCWPLGASFSTSCFATSKDLLEHTKISHAADRLGVADKPFRCALAGCGKSWKSLNGLQYHLQISTAHFRKALSTFSQKQGGHNVQETSSSPDSDSDADSGEEDGTRIYVCHHPHCSKAYRQSSGLRYHLKHGHPQEQPVQLPTVPPALARQLPSKTRKMRPKVR